ncbi:MAG: endonuclease/exonuclease/phosphatase family protein [Gemmataceae bacterium]
MEQIGRLAVSLSTGAILLAFLGMVRPSTAQTPVKLGPSTFTFAFWNVENLFDDKENPNLEEADRPLDQFFARNPKFLKAKLDNLAKVLLDIKQFAGKGPDILCLAEVESKRAVELLRERLHADLKDKRDHYSHLVYLDPAGGRRIATAVLSRVAVVGKPELLSSQRRILKLTLQHNKHQLTVVASHWSSRISDNTGRGRAAYAEAIHRDYSKMVAADARVRYVVCGDFNDNPDDPAVTKNLNATGEVKAVLDWKKGERPIFYNPFMDLAKKNKATLYFGPTGYVFDQIVVSPGMLEPGGWEYRNRSASIVELLCFEHRLSNTKRPNRFGGPDDKRPLEHRGASDHYPVKIELKVP